MARYADGIQLVADVRAGRDSAIAVARFFHLASFRRPLVAGCPFARESDKACLSMNQVRLSGATHGLSF
jgi:hypothetical protein